MSKPKIGIALGSGSAKGWAHIGVLKRLSELGIEPDIVAGCSVGAFVGASYAAGNLNKLDDWVRGFSNWNLMSVMDLSWRKGGLITGEKVFDQAKSMLGPSTIEELEIAFTAVATELYSGQEIWLQKGSLREAVRASCSIPGLMAPKQLGQQWLIDGAVVNPIPISVCRAMGADLVIAVDLYGYPAAVDPMAQVANQMPRPGPDMPEVEGPPRPDDEHSHFTNLLSHGRSYFNDIVDKFVSNQGTQPNMFAVMSTALDILEARHKKSRLAGDPPEIMIMPKVAHIASMEFNRGQEAMTAGEASVDQISHVLEAQLLRWEADQTAG